MSHTLVFGLSGQVGESLAGMRAELGPLLAISRTPRPGLEGIEWQRASLETCAAAPPDCARILSLGPLDAFAQWVERTRPAGVRIVAIGSTGVRDKRESPDAHERALAHRLAAAEHVLSAHAAATDCQLTLLRPSLLYGSGRDHSLTPLAARARRWRRLPWPRSATGLRQPVHVDDVARAVVDCLASTATHGAAFDLPGAEALRFDAMVERHLARHAPGARLWRLPDAAFRLAMSAAGRGKGVDGWLWRARRDQLADAEAARAAFGFSPRAFQP